MQWSNWYVTPQGAVGVVIIKTMGVHRAREIRNRITMRMNLLERGLHTVLLGYTEVERDAREGIAVRGGGE